MLGTLAVRTARGCKDWLELCHVSVLSMINWSYQICKAHKVSHDKVQDGAVEAWWLWFKGKGQ